MKKKVIVKDFCRILFLYLVTYFVDKKNQNGGEDVQEEGGGLCV